MPSPPAPLPKGEGRKFAKVQIKKIIEVCGAGETRATDAIAVFKVKEPT